MIVQLKASVETTTLPILKDDRVSSPSRPPSSVQCPTCGRMFGSKSIKFHEPQCVKKHKIIGRGEPGTAPNNAGKLKLKWFFEPDYLTCWFFKPNLPIQLSGIFGVWFFDQD